MERLIEIFVFILGIAAVLAIIIALSGCTPNQIEDHADRGVFARGSTGSAGGMYQIIRGETSAQACGLGELGEQLHGRLIIMYKDKNCELRYER